MDVFPGLVSLVITHGQKRCFLVRVRGLAPATLLTQSLRILHRHQPVTLETVGAKIYGK